MQKKFGTLSSLSNDDIRSEIAARADAIETLSRPGEGLYGKRVVELGTGWHGLDSILMALAGARVVTVDHLPHLDMNLFRRVLAVLRDSPETLAVFAGRVGLRETDVRERLTRLSNWDPELSSPEIRSVSLHNQSTLTYLVTGDYLRWVREQSDKFDVFYTYSVLQRLPLVRLKNTIFEFGEALEPGGLHYHVVHHTDHMARHGVVSPLGYLRVPDWLFDPIQSRRYNYQNRIRSVEFLNLLRLVATPLHVGLESCPESDVPLRAVERFQQFEIDQLRVARTEVLARRRSLVSGSNLRE